METNKDISQKTSKSNLIEITLRNICCFCGLETQTTQMVDVWVASLIKERDTKFACKACAEKIKRVQENEALVMKAEINLRESGIPDNFLEWDSSKGNKDLANAIRLEHQKNLYVNGFYGTCKTRALCANLIRRIKSGEKGKYVRFGTLANQYQKCFTKGEYAPEAFVKSILKTDILLIDDVGKRKITQTAGELLYEILDRIYAGDTKCRIWITCNADLKSFVRKFEKF